MKTTIAILNDREIKMYLDVQHCTKEAWEREHLILLPTEMREVEIEIPENSIPFLKIWESGFALLSYIKKG